MAVAASAAGPSSRWLGEPILEGDMVATEPGHEPASLQHAAREFNASAPPPRRLRHWEKPADTAPALLVGVVIGALVAAYLGLDHQALRPDSPAVERQFIWLAEPMETAVRFLVAFAVVYLASRFVQTLYRLVRRGLPRG